MHVCTLVATLGYESVAIAATGNTKSDSKTLLDEGMLADFLIGCNEHAEFEEQLSDKYLEAIDVARSNGDINAMIDLCSKLRVSIDLFYQEI